MAQLLPKRWEGRVTQLGLDLRMVLDGVRGRVPPPFVPRRGSRFDAWPLHERAAGLATRRVRVEQVVRETDSAVTLRLRDVRLAPVRVVPGQFFTFRLDIDGVEYRRAYSACHDCRSTDFFSVTVKRVEGGVVSNHINDHVREGDELDVLGPSGDFIAHPTDPARGGEATPRRLVLVAGGSGITPMMAIASTLLETDRAVKLALVFGNKRAADILFRGRLDDLVAAHPGRFLVRHVLEQPGPDEVEVAVGRLDADVLGEVLDGIDRDEPTLTEPGARYYVCGPEPMMVAAREQLRRRGVADEHIVEERFSAPHLRVGERLESFAPQRVSGSVEGREVAFATEEGETLLEAGLRAGVPMPHSCAMGGCAACRVRLVEGEVVMEEPNCLSEDERAAGQILACVARPRTGVRFEVAR